MTAFVPQFAHVRVLGGGDPGWGQSQRWAMEGADPSVSVYDAASARDDDGLHSRVRAGVKTEHGRLPLDAPTMTRGCRVGAAQSSLPAASSFQGYFATSFSWLAGFNPAITPRPLYQNWSPAQAGSKELHPATVYNPWPAGGDLYPKAV